MRGENKKKEKTLVLGVGNEILTDDGIGPRLVDRLKKELPHSDLDFEKICLGGLEIIEFIKGYRNVVIIDAIKTETGKPGDIYLLTPDNFRETHHLSSFHDVSFLTGLKMGKKLGFDLPEVVLIIAVEIVEDTIFDESFSREIQSKYEQIYKEIYGFLEPAINGDQTVDSYRSLIMSEKYEKI